MPNTTNRKACRACRLSRAWRVWLRGANRETAMKTTPNKSTPPYSPQATRRPKLGVGPRAAEEVFAERDACGAGAGGVAVIPEGESKAESVGQRRDY